MLIRLPNLKHDFSEILKDDTVIKTVKVFTLLIVIFITIFIWKWQKLPPQIPLFYSLPRGTETLGYSIQILTLPVYSLIFFFLDFLIASLIYKREKLAAILLLIAGCVVTFLILITFLKIVFLVS